MNEAKIIADLPCERLVIGTLLQRPKEWLVNADILSADIFYHFKTKTLYNALKSLVDKGKEANIITVLPELEREKANH